MSSSVLSISSKPATELDVSDLLSLIQMEAEESDLLELKRDLQTPDGSRGWIEVGKLHRGETRGLAKEIVALANHRGGRIYIGIEESEDDPKRAVRLAKPLPNIAALCERLEDGLDALISPRIAGLRIVPLASSSSSGDGYLIIDVPQSMSAPHGFGSPPECFRRRGSKSQPMEMHEMQSLFWEARTRRERIEQEQRAASERLSRILFGINPGLKFRFTVISEAAFGIQKIAQQLRGGLGVSSSNPYFGEGYAENPLVGNGNDWDFASFGAVRIGTLGKSPLSKFRWHIDETGIIEVSGIVTADITEELIIEPYYLASSAAYLFCIATIIGRSSQPPQQPWILDGELFTSPASHPLVRNGHYPTSSKRIDLQHGATFRPLQLNLEIDAQEVFTVFEDRLWAAFGQDVPNNHRVEYVIPKVA